MRPVDLADTPLTSAIAVRADLRARTVTGRAPAAALERRLARGRRRDKRPTPALDAVLTALDGAASA